MNTDAVSPADQIRNLLGIRETLHAWLGRVSDQISETALVLNNKDVGLTPQETRILPLVRSHLSNKEIANRMNISESTAKFHISRLMRKRSVGRRMEL